MLKMKNKVIFSLFVAIILVLISTMSFADYNTVQMTVVDEPVATIKFGENSKFEKKLISKDTANKEVTLQLQVTNGEKSAKPTGEVVLVLDNSKSMMDEVTTTSGKVTRKQLIFESAKKMINDLLKDNDSLKIGVVSFSTNTDSSKEGTAEDAKVVSKLSSDASAITKAIDAIEADGPRTDLESGLDLGMKQFSSESNNKYMIVLTDGVPNVSLGHNNPYYSDEEISATKAKLQSVANGKINLITMLTGIVDENATATGTTKTYGSIIKDIFGTAENPTAGTFYNVSDSEIEKTVTTIYNSLVPTSISYKNLKIVDYFPKEIIDNFDFSYVSKANIGEISAEVDKTNNSITWTIPELASGQTATVQYKLKLKQNYDSSIVGKILNTNDKVDISYTDFSGNEKNDTTDVTPKLKLAEPPKQLPKAGLNVIIATGIGALAIVAIYSFAKYKNIDK